MYPHEFELLWRLSIEGPLAASEISESVNRGAPHYALRNGQAISNQMRGHLRRGFVQHDDGTPRIYRLTDAGREYVDA